MFFNELLTKYSKINIPTNYQEISKADKAISWYLADSTNQFVTISKSNNINIIELDIRQAFTTICNCLFEPNNSFLVQMNKIEDKKSRNIFIATSLVNTEYLRLLNIISKVVICGVLFEINNITLLELKKDGAIITCDDDTLNKLINLKEITDSSLPFLNYIISHNFNFHTTEFKKYIRSNKTSYFLDLDDNLIIKGIYKHSPNFIKKLQKNIIQNNFQDFNEIIKIYSKKYLNIILINHLNELLTDYYLCDNKKFVSYDNKYISNKNDIDPEIYLKTFIYPIILSTKL